MNISEYAEAIKQKYATGQAREHAYRSILEELMQSFENIDAVNEPKKSAYGNPDLVFLKKSHQTIILGYAEAKDIDKDLDKIEKTEQLERYSGYENLYLTNYLEFRFFQNGEKYKSVEIGKFVDGEIVLKPENYDALRDELAHFIELPPEAIKSGKRLAQIMGAKGRRIRNNVAEYLADDSSIKSDELEKIYKMMQTLLVHDLTPEKFADMYAQTLVYGLFVARYGDKTPDEFTRQEARDLVPKSNPFLQKFFDHIVGPEFVTSLSYIVDELCEVFSVSNVAEIVHKHLKILDETAEKDPIIHFYEDFLKEYDPVERKKMGAYYTPLPVVRFIIREVDQILKDDFGIAKGLADAEKKTIGTYKHSTKQTLHRVQILDPAVGTATFLNEIIKHIRKDFEGQEGRWESYVKEDLLPRLYGFELMMAPYTIAHLKLGMTLQESGVNNLEQRLGVYLTNSLEEGMPNQLDMDMTFGLSSAVADEAHQAGVVKHDRPVMVVIGNPPYSGHSSNNTPFAKNLAGNYKIEPGGGTLNEKNSKFINDDYVKFIALAEQMIAKNGEGIIAMITNHGYLDNPTFRGMRWHLSQTFSKIYVLDLHGNSKKSEVALDGSKDENVFDIMQGVSILIGVKIKSTTRSTIYRADLWGTRKSKFASLNTGEIEWQAVKPGLPYFTFNIENNKIRDKYNSFVNVRELFKKSSIGLYTGQDSKSTFISREQAIMSISTQGESGLADKIHPYRYRCFYDKYLIDDEAFIARSRTKYFDQVYLDEPALIVGRQVANNWSLIFTAAGKIDLNLMRGGAFHLPTYIKDSNGNKISNIDQRLLATIMAKVNVDFSEDQVISYIYGVLHSAEYRRIYRDYLKIDFPRIPPANDNDTFNKLSLLGYELRELHLMLSPVLDKLTTTFPENGSDIVEEVKYWPEETKVFWKNDVEPLVHKAHTVTINKEQYFGNIPEAAWNFYIGGYQPAQKWLKDRKGVKLTSDDIVHYQKIIKVLVETDRIMKEIDELWNP